MHSLKLVTLISLVAGAVSAANAGFKDLGSCLDYAVTIPNPGAAQAYETGCRLTYNSTESGEGGLTKRCSSTEGFCCCVSFCDLDLTCPECAAGCEASCVAQFGQDCEFDGDCPSC
jgi:hypothetical protein